MNGNKFGIKSLPVQSATTDDKYELFTTKLWDRMNKLQIKYK